MNLKNGIDKMVVESQPEQLKQFVLDKIFGNEEIVNEAKNSHLEKPYMFKKGDKVNVIKPGNHFDDGEYEIIGFYNNGNIVEKNTASPYSKNYGIRLRNFKTGKEYPVTANNLELVKGE